METLEGLHLPSANRTSFRDLYMYDDDSESSGPMGPGSKRQKVQSKYKPMLRR